MISIKKCFALVLLFVLIITFSGCYTVKVGGKAQLAPSDQTGTLVAQERYWYALYGLIPLDDNSTDNYIPATAKKVRVETKMTAVDFILNLLTGMITVYSTTAEIYEVK